MTSQQIRNYIKQQFKAGESKESVTAKLEAMGVSNEEIGLAMADVELGESRPKESAGSSVLSILVSIIFIILGIYRVSSNSEGFQHTWGFVLIGAGVVGLILKLAIKR